jgi:hypothetical protein
MQLPGNGPLPALYQLWSEAATLSAALAILQLAPSPWTAAPPRLAGGRNDDGWLRAYA